MTRRADELNPSSLSFVEEVYNRWLGDPSSVGPDWRRYFEGLEARTRCGPIDLEFGHISDLTKRNWLRDLMEQSSHPASLAPSERVRILRRLTEAAVLERFLQRKFPGAKTFSLAGAESLVPLLDAAVEVSRDQGVMEIVLAMAHRGRLNVLANVLDKPPAEIFAELKDREWEGLTGGGDIGSHLGHSTDRRDSDGRSIHMSLCFNPSHLEFVNPVALGRVRAKQDRAGDRDRQRAFGILVHGDAAVAGEGIVQETLNLARLESYATGGTLHVVLDNGIGFTTPPSEYMSSERVTGVFRLLDIPIFHAGSDDPESVVGAVRHALRFRRSFACDVAIDLHCYRRFGHSEADDASFTQPLLSKAIRRRQPVRDRYRDRLLEDGVTTSAAARKMEAGHRESLARAFSQLGDRDSGSRPRVAGGVWKGCHGGPEPKEEPDTSVSVERLQAWLLGQTRTPAGFRVHRKIQKGMESRRKMAGGELPLDWAAAESLAFASLAAEGVPVRLSGQDSARGTFGQRHAVLHDQETGACYVPLQHVSSEQAPVEIGNSPLSEAGVLGFEYGYSLDRPGALLLWEAQFGDFANAAQVIVDQFIASAEDKWNRLSGITLLLPHGFEGMGPEHSSARPERFLLLAAEDNIQILCPTTPAQYFHALRRQGLWRWKKPLVVLTPKGLLRSRHSRSTLDECGRGRFERIRADRAEADPERVRRVLLCTGRVAIDLERARQEREAWDVAVLRLEQLYPFRDDLLERALAPYTESESAFWVQEEPENMGAWRYLRTRYPDELPGGARLSLVSRPESASPATGSSRAHQHEQAELIARAFDAG